MAELYGKQNIGFMTLTFPDGVFCHREASRRFHSMAVNYLTERFGPYIAVREKTKKGVWHYHLAIVCHFNVQRHGVFYRKDYKKGGKPSYGFRTTNWPLVNLWKELRKRLPHYGFGRAELLPIRKGHEVFAGYLSKYISKHYENTHGAKKGQGIRLVFYAKRLVRAVSPYFSFHSRYMTKLRRQVKYIASNFGCSNESELRDLWGPKWAFLVFTKAAYMLEMSEIVFFNEQSDLIRQMTSQKHIELSSDGNLFNIYTGEVVF